MTGKVCKTDVTKLCAGIVPGTGGIRACIKSHVAEVSDHCRDAMSRAAAGKKILGGGDLQNFAAGETLREIALSYNVDHSTICAQGSPRCRGLRPGVL